MEKLIRNSRIFVNDNSCLNDGLKVLVNEKFCMSVSDFYEDTPHLHNLEYVVKCYDEFKRETYIQFSELLKNYEILPYIENGQPYKSYIELKNSFLSTNRLFVFLTENGYGENTKPSSHPMLEKTDFIINEKQFCYNDLFRAVHDIYGHILSGGNFSLSGELLAANSHLKMYSKYAKLAAFTETVAQISWYFYGRHLRKGNKIIQPNDTSYLSPDKRPYSEQKAIIFPFEMIELFKLNFSYDN
jgi:hypothetical protein